LLRDPFLLLRRWIPGYKSRSYVIDKDMKEYGGHKLAEGTLSNIEKRMVTESGPWAFAWFISMGKSK